MSRRALVVGLCAVAAAAALAWVAIRGAAAPTSPEDRVRAVAATLRCPVCQNLTVADSPSAVARQMRETIARDLDAGLSPDQIRARFADAYGEWVLLAPPRRGWDLVAWLAPAALVVGGLVALAVAVRRWTRPPSGATGEPSARAVAPSARGRAS